METLERIKAKNIHPIPQDHSKATYAPPLRKEDGHIDWEKEAEEIGRRVRAFNPWPGAFTEWDGRLLKIYKGEVRKEHFKGSQELSSGQDRILLKWKRERIPI